MRNLYKKLEHNASQYYLDDQPTVDKSQERVAELQRRKTMAMQEGVGDLEEKGEFGLGVAPRDAKPVNKIVREEDIEKDQAAQEESEEEEEQEEEEQKEEEEVDGLTKRRRLKDKKRDPIDKQTAFIEFKQGEGQELEQKANNLRNQIREAKQQCKNFTDQCNHAKSEMDQVKADLDRKAQEKKDQINEIEEDEEIVDEEEFGMIKKLKELKKVYRSNFEQLKQAKSNVNSLNKELDDSKQELITAFEKWMEETFEEDVGKAEMTSNMGRSVKRGQQASLSPVRSQDGTVEGDNIDVDKDAMAFIRAKKHVGSLHKAKKAEKRIK